jgi:hypothetical protein
MLQAFSLAVMVIPSDTVIRAVGRPGPGGAHSHRRVLPGPADRVARRTSADPELRLLCAALAGAALAAAICSLTFDSLSFPMFSNVYALVIGLIGACWRFSGAGADPGVESEAQP